MDRIFELFLTVCNMSMTASFVIIIVMFARLLIRELPKKYSFYLWAIVGFRLICPYSIPSIFSMFNLKIFQNHASPGSQIIWASSEALEKNMTTAALMEDVSASNALTGTSNAASTSDLVETVRTAGERGKDMSSITTQISSSWDLSLPEILAVIWIVGMIIFLIYQFISYTMLCRKVKTAVQFEKGVYECDSISSPFVMGLIRPRVYVPFRMTESERSYILLHEQYHIRRHDYQVKLLAVILLAVHWFNPLVWVAFSLMCKDMEMSCDEKVIGVFGKDIKKEYSTSLLRYASGKRNWAASPLTFGDVPVKTRIQNVLNFKKPRRIAILIGLFVCVADTAIGLGNGKRENYIHNISTIQEGYENKIVYEYDLPEQANSYLLYKEWYQDGILIDYEIIDSYNLGKDQRKGTLTLESRIDFLKYSTMTFKFPDAGYERTDSNLLLEEGYSGVAGTYYLENGVDLQKLDTESDLVLAAWNLAGRNGTGNVEGISCEDYMEEQSKTVTVGKNDGVILYHIRFSEKTAEELKAEYTFSPFAKELYALYNPYVGDVPADEALIQALAIAPEVSRTMELKTEEAPYTLILHFNEMPIEENEFYHEMIKKAAALITFIGNLDQVEWTYSIDGESRNTDRHFCLNREQAEALLDVESLVQFTNTEESVQEFLDIFPYIKISYETVELSMGDYYISSTGEAYSNERFIFSRLPGEEYDSVYRVLTNEEDIDIQDVAEALESGGRSDILYLVKEISKAEWIENQKKTESEGYLAYDGKVYQNRMILTGRHPNAEKDSTYLVYTNREKTSFEDVTDYLFGSLYPKEEMCVVSLPSEDSLE